MNQILSLKAAEADQQWAPVTIDKRDSDRLAANPATGAINVDILFDSLANARHRTP
jgi:hypothetical protein